LLINKNAGMQTLDQSLVYLVNRGLINKSDAILKTSHPDILNRMLTNP
jgi:Tfp pilus assembly ATPase PilU